MKSLFKSPQDLKNVLLSNGYIELGFCMFESMVEGSVNEIEHYELLKPGQKIGNGCADLDRISLHSDAAREILELYINTDKVRIHPDIFSS